LPWKFVPGMRDYRSRQELSQDAIISGRIQMAGHRFVVRTDAGLLPSRNNLRLGNLRGRRQNGSYKEVEL
jgi:hypothetical protein